MTSYKQRVDEELDLLREESDSDSDERETDNEWNLECTLKTICDALVRRRGLLYALCAGTGAGLQFSVVKGLSLSISPYQIMLCRCLLFLLPITCISWERSVHYSRADMVYYLGYGIFNSLAILFGYAALQFAHVGNVTAIALNLPIPATILGFIILREPITMFDTLLFVINLIGIIMVSKPPFLFGFVFGNEDAPAAPSTINPPMTHTTYEDAPAAASTIDPPMTPTTYEEFTGAMIALGALSCLVISVIFSRKLTYREHSDPALTTVMPGMVGIFLSGGVLLISQTWDIPSSVWEFMMILSAGTCGLLGNLFLVLALKYESVLVVSVLTTICVPVSFVVGVLVLNNATDIMSIVGATLVLVSTCGCLWK